ncbi:C39 family peptidase [Ideonella azotifigens]|uniref:C39 family peptidase n=1 Tax=Ideonella azotifigens TaxID=513160 RepID=A0ABN1KA30_9BURK|nr:C39 family peptidase [Ideonella azotifigens]MCD2338952.1 C39 family peptidase [Ideonella azotifigens]
MWTILLGVIASAITGAGVSSEVEPQDRPANQFELPMQAVGGGPAPESVVMRPQSEFKFENIVHQAYDYSCGSAALTTVLRYHLGYPVTEQQSMEGMLKFGESDKIIARRGFSLLDMKRYVATLGSNSAGFKAELSDLAALKDPAIVPIDYAGFKHFVVFRGLRGGKVFLADPAAGHIVFSQEDFAQLWDRNTLFIIYPPASVSSLPRALALSDQEMGVIDIDRLRDPAVLDTMNHREALERAVQAGFGNFFFRRQ